MELRQVQYAVAVVDAGSFTRAAATQHVAQPSLSQSVRTLEAELGAPLFYRLGRRIALTPAGEAFLGPARQLLRDAGTVAAAVESVAGLRAGHVDLVGLPALAADPIAPLIGSFRLRHPEVTVRLAEPDDADAVVQMVRDGRSELGFAAAPFPDDLVVHDAFEQEILAVCPPGTRVRRRGRLSLAELASMPLVTTPLGTSTRSLLDEVLAGAAVAPRIAVETGQREAIVVLVLAGAGTCFLPAPLARAAAQRGAVALSLDPPLRRRIALIHRRGPLAPAARAFSAFALPRLAES